jgi:CRP-like cAMP-binding protein
MTKEKTETENFKAGDTLFREGDASGCLYIIKEGQVQVYITTAEQKIPLAIVNSGQFLGELSCVLGGYRTATAVALTSVKAVRIKKDFMDDALKETPGWMSGLIKCLAERIHDMNDILRRNRIVDEQLKTKMAAAESRVDKNKFGQAG